MNVIKIKNRTALTDFSALFRAALYFYGDSAQAMENGMCIKARKGLKETVIVTITETVDRNEKIFEEGSGHDFQEVQKMRASNGSRGRIWERMRRLHPFRGAKKGWREGRGCADLHFPGRRLSKKAKAERALPFRSWGGRRP